MSIAEDEEFLYVQLPHPTEAEVEAYLERVAIMIESGLTETPARYEAVKCLREARRG
jgi:hypothetical protein